MSALSPIRPRPSRILTATDVLQRWYDRPICACACGCGSTPYDLARPTCLGCSMERHRPPSEQPRIGWQPPQVSA